jgi:HD-GYP domain-containing protein (c-di-GMP phosphodiesterase class II)
MVLARTVWGASGEVLLSRGTVLTPEAISALGRCGPGAVWVADGGPDPADPVSDGLRAEAASCLRDLFSAVSCGASGAAVSSLVRRLRETAGGIVGEVLSAPAGADPVAVQVSSGWGIQHAVDVAAGCVLLGARLGLGRAALRALALGGLLHDVGKVRVPPEVLNKPGPLTPGEWDLMRQHPVWGCEIVARLGLDDALAACMAWQHHERQDGRGYPRGLRGTNRAAPCLEFPGGDRIALCAEICAVADVYSTMRSDRPYRPGVPPEDAVRGLREAAGTQLNRELVDLFLVYNVV